MSWEIEVTPEDEDEMISEIAQTIHKYGVDSAAILMIETIKPLSYIGGEMGRFFIFPFLSALGENNEISGEKFLQIFEKRDNLEKLIQAVEELTREEEEKKKSEKAKKLEEKKVVTETGETPKKNWWLRFLPF